MTRKRLSIITPCYNEEENVEHCYEALQRVMADKLPQYDYEHIFTDNASTDRTYAVLRMLAARDERVKLIQNSRNIGALGNIFNALAYASGDATVVMLPADLQDPPDVIPQFVAHWEQGARIVYGIRMERQEAWWLRTGRRIYYTLVKKFSDVQLIPDAGEFQLIDRFVLNQIRNVDDYYPYVRGLVARTAMPYACVPYRWGVRHKGLSKATLMVLIDQALNGIISSSKMPIRICIFLGFFCSVFSLLYAAIGLVLSILFYGSVTAGIPTLIVAQFFFNGLILFFFGILGEYVSAIHEQVRRGPAMIPLDLVNFAPEVVQQAQLPPQLRAKDRLRA